MRKLLLIVILSSLASPTFAQAPPQQFVPFVLDLEKVNEIFATVPMVDATRDALTRKFRQWELEAQKAADEKTKVPTPPANPPAK